MATKVWSGGAPVDFTSFAPYVVDAIYGEDVNNCPCNGQATDVTAHVTCVGGKITGTFTLQGDIGPPDCATGAFTCTATVG